MLTYWRYYLSFVGWVAKTLLQWIGDEEEEKAANTVKRIEFVLSWASRKLMRETLSSIPAHYGSCKWTEAR